MPIFKMSWEDDPFSKMTDRQKEIFNLGMDLLAMPEDHPDYKSDLERFNRLIEEEERSLQHE